MVGRFLITTADERTWRTDVPVLFLGEWCRLYERRHVWEKLDAAVAPYHWDDREKLFNDYKYLIDLYERLLADLSEVLNQYHGVNHSLRYWRILIGPWLGYFTQILFDRWAVIERTVRDFSLTEHFSLNLPEDEMIPNDHGDFQGFYIDDVWNHFIYSYIIKNYFPICEPINVSVHPKKQIHPEICLGRKSLVGRLRSQLTEKLFRTGMLSSKNDCFFITTYLPQRTSMLLQACLGQIPKLWRNVPVPRVAPRFKDRKHFTLSFNTNCDFEHCLKNIISMQIPTVYLEGYRELKKTVDEVDWPIKPKIIFTSNNYDHDDTFKLWAAEKTSDSTFVIGQHGGHYGTGLWSFSEYHQRMIADRFLTWGWTDGGKEIYPLGILKLLGAKKKAWNPNGGILLVTAMVPRYSYWMYSIIIGPQVIKYFEDQFQFVDSLDPRLRCRTTVRAYIKDYCWGQTERWKDRFPDVVIDDGHIPIDKLLENTRIYVSTYNATTFLETLASNIPTIIFWNPKHWELRPAAIPFFERLKDVGIFHETPESAARKINSVWDDVEGWWKQKKVQEARKYFCNRFARIPNQPIRTLLRALRSVV